jgi:hypothetical protein
MTCDSVGDCAAERIDFIDCIGNCSSDPCYQPCANDYPAGVQL